MSSQEEPQSMPEAVASAQKEAAADTTKLTSIEKDWGMACHLSALSGFVIPFGSFLGPLIVWLVKRNEYDYVDIQGKEALNFQLTVLLATLVSGVLVLVVVGFILLAFVWIFSLVMTIIASVKASSGEYYQYPLTIRFLK